MYSVDLLIPACAECCMLRIFTDALFKIEKKHPRYLPIRNLFNKSWSCRAKNEADLYMKRSPEFPRLLCSHLCKEKESV